MDRRWRSWCALTVVLCAVTGCGGGEATDADTTPASPTPTIAPTTSAATLRLPGDAGSSSARNETGPAGESDTTRPEGIPSDSLPQPDSARPNADSNGSTAAPTPNVSIVAPEFEALGDGTHFGYLTAVDLGAERIEFDVAQFLTGAAATDAALAAGTVNAENPTPPGGYLVVNANAVRRWLPTAPNVSVSLLRSADSPGVEPSSMIRLSALMNMALEMPNPTGVTAHVVVAGGQVTAIEQQYLP